MSIKIIYSVNAGICLNIGDVRIWVDFLHEKKVPPFSTVSKELFEQLLVEESVMNPDLIVFTHIHEDHFSKKMIERAYKRFPDAKIIGPTKEFDNQILLKNNREEIDVKGVHISFIRLLHEGEEYRDVINYGLYIEADGKSILIPADCEVANPDLTEFLNGKNVDVAILDFPWITLKRGYSYVKETMCPKRIVVYHLPLEEEDGDRYAHLLKRALRNERDIDFTILTTPLQTEVL